MKDFRMDLSLVPSSPIESLALRLFSGWENFALIKGKPRVWIDGEEAWVFEVHPAVPGCVYWDRKNEFLNFHCSDKGAIVELEYLA